MLFVQLPSVIPCIDSISKKLFPFQEKVDHRGIRTPNLLIRSQTPYPLGHAAMHPVNQSYLFVVQLPSVIPCIDSISKKFPLQEKVDHRGIRTPNLLIRSQTPYPLGHAAMYFVNCICYMFSCQVLSLILTSFVRTFLCVKQNVDHKGIRTPNLLIRSQTPYPLGHAAMHPVNQLYVICSVAKCYPLYRLDF